MMLREFTVENYKSFYSPATLRMTNDDGSIAKFTAIFGGNAAGKSNIIKAMRDAKQIITNPDYKLPSPVFSKSGQIDPCRISKFEFVFSINSDGKSENIYQFKISISSKMSFDPLLYYIETEELWDITDANDIKKIYYWDKSDDIQLLKKTGEKTSDDDFALDKREKQIEIDMEYDNAVNDKRILERTESELKNKLSGYESDYDHLSDTIKLVIEEYYNKLKNNDDGDEGANLINEYENKIRNDQSLLAGKNIFDRIKSTKEALVYIKLKMKEADEIIDELDKKRSKIRKNKNKSRFKGSILFQLRSDKKAEIEYDHEYEDAIDRIFYWFSDTLNIVSPDDNILSVKLSDSMEELSSVIDKFDVGVKKIFFAKMSESECVKRKEEFLEDGKIRGMMETCLKLNKYDIFSSFIVGTLSGIYEIGYWHGKYSIKKLMALHDDKSSSEFEISYESDGTRRLIEIASILVDEIDDRVFIIDELDRRMHTLLTCHLIKQYKKLNYNNKQLIITTHEPKLLDMADDLDSIWVVDRVNNNSEIKRINNKRRDRSFEKMYLEGIFGGMPKIS